MKTLQMITFLIIVTTIYAGMHFLVYKILVAPFRLTGWAHKIALIVLWTGAASFILGEICSNRHYEKFYWLLFGGSVWLGMLSITLTGSIAYWVITRFLPVHLRMTSLYITLGLIGCAVIVALFNGLGTPVIKRHALQLPAGKEHLKGFTIVQLTDIHIGNLTTIARIRHIARTVNELKPDLIVITGDLFDGFNGDEEKDALLLKSLTAPHGVIVIPGNHEYYSGIDTFLRISKDNGAIILKDSIHVMDNGITIVGFDDYDRRYADKKRPPAQEIVANAPADSLLIALRHRPLYFNEAKESGVFLQLSGHTHAGQVPPMDLMVFFAYKFPVGLYKVGNSYQYTSPGTGTWGPPMRLFSRNEISVFELK